MSKIAVNEITDELGTGAPAFPNGMSVTGAALTDPEITGGIYLGGTGSANKLEDYEEGTWTPTLDPSDTGSISAVSGVYTKIGSLVFVSFVFDKTAGSDNLIGGLPFSIKQYGSKSFIGAALNAQEDDSMVIIQSASNNLSVRRVSDRSALTSADMRVSFSYYTDS